MELNSELDRAQKNLSDFTKLVSEMRKFQKNYFRYRDPLSLQSAKKAEQVVDAELERLTGNPVKKKETVHPTLF